MVKDKRSAAEVKSIPKSLYQKGIGISEYTLNIFYYLS